MSACICWYCSYSDIYVDYIHCRTKLHFCEHSLSPSFQFSHSTFSIQSDESRNSLSVLSIPLTEMDRNCLRKSLQMPNDTRFISIDGGAAICLLRFYFDWECGQCLWRRNVRPFESTNPMIDYFIFRLHILPLWALFDFIRAWIEPKHVFAGVFILDLCLIS